MDLIRQYYASTDKVSEDDGCTIRMALFDIVKYYIQKDLNIKEVCVIVAYISSVNDERLIKEIIELLLAQMNHRSCLDQLFLLMHEPQTAELCYALLTDRKYSTNLHKTVIKVNSFESTNVQYT